MPTTRALHRRILLPAIALVALALPASAFGQASRTWVSGVGDDVNPCSRTAPCKTFAGAISKTAAAGEINVLDPGGFGAVTINKSITIDGENTQSGIVVSGGNGVNVAAGVNDRVMLKGLNIDGLNNTGGTALGQNGIRVTQASRVKVQNTRIFSFGRSGIDYVPTNNNAKLILSNVRSHDNAGDGLLVAPTTATGVVATVRNSQFDDNVCGAAVSRFGEGGVFTSNCGAAGAGTASAAINSFHSSFGDNSSVGVFANGNTAVQRISDDDVTGNGTGLFVANAGNILSWKNNFVSGNGVDGASTGTLTPAKKRTAHKAHRYH
jgi:hypothetical protein